ncbi:K02A2.6-like [Cordylochernes scorpioides]|uniref:K02A2.6-like n=1 Tax=Cordylochernes scorpioides TaxID=51811 RepID=A0ABY6LV52_9ARAC|nr:K02A2.6-like [Cordylochernes scorpioides]
MSRKQRNVEHAMTPIPNTIEIPKFNGQNLNIISWLKFFNKKCLQKHLDEDFKQNNISNYLEGEAFNYYIEELQDINNWGEIEQKLTSYFTINDSNLFSRFLNLKYNDKDDLEQYFKEKSALANKLNLEKTLLLEALTDGMPDHLKKYIIAARVQEPSEWYKITIQLKLSTNKEEEPQQPSTSTSTPVKRFNSNSSKAHQYQPFPRTAAATHHQQEPYKSINQPPYPCKICASHQLPNQIHFHRDCPLKNNNHPKRINPVKIYTILDVKNAYWHIPIDEKDRHKTSFVTQLGCYEWNRLPYGLKNAPSQFERIMKSVFTKHNIHYALNYFDDIFIHSKTYEEHIKHLDDILGIFEQEDIKLNLNKCKFLQKEIQFLGYTINSGKYTPNNTNIEAILKLNRPYNIKTLQRFLGTINIYNKFIPHYAQIRAPLNELLLKNAPWLWSVKHEQAFQTLKNSLISQPVLYIYDPSKPCHLFTDASSLGVAGVLKQPDEQGILHPIGYFSRKLHPYEQNYTASEIETLAIINSVQRFHTYLHNIHFTLHTDHLPLKWIKNVKNPQGRSFRWSLILSQYSFDIKHIKGLNNIEADMLSRAPVSFYLTYNELKEHQTTEQISNTLGGLHNYGTTRHSIHMIVDHHSRFLWAFPTKSVLTDSYITCLRNLFQINKPEILITDRNAAFLSNKFKHFLDRNNVKHLLTSAHHPETNAKVERLNSTIINRLRCEYNANLKIPWTKYIPKITESYNETVHTTTGFTPKFLYYGIQPQYIEHDTVTHTPIEKARNLAIERTIKSHEHSKQLYDIKHPEPIFKEGDQVLVKTFIYPNTETPWTTGSIPPTTSPFQKIGIYYLGRFPISHTGNRWIIVATDYLTRFAITKAATTAEVTELATFLIEDVILNHGAPREIITD